MKFLKAAVVAVALLFVGSFSAVLHADTPPHIVHHHPRRRQVRRRIRRQRRRINRKVRHGKMSAAEGAKLKRNDADIHAEEKDMSAQNGGTITKQDQNTLNQQLNQNNNAIVNH
ncbi:MAG TPA: hypothetical protein VK786_00380 [bacterium]|jgi:hypothetical protein|nr:hypothetical protein [bacterium]